MLANLLKPHADLAALILRLGLAAIFIVHGFIKIDQDSPLIRGISMTAQTVVGWAELVCGLALAVGLLSRIACLTIIALQVGAIVLVSGKHALEGVRVELTGADYMRVGPEYNLVLIAMCLGVIVLGSGACSLDRLLSSRWRRKRADAAPN